MAENNNNGRRWLKPSKRAKGYAEERKNGVHMRGEKKGQELDDYNKGLRSGYMLAQSDSAGMYRYKQARNAGLTKEQAAEYSRQKGTKLPEVKTSAKSTGKTRKPKLEAFSDEDEVGLPF